MTRSEGVSASPMIAIKRMRQPSQDAPAKIEANRSGSPNAARMVMSGFMGRPHGAR